jgi:hypothetical protein
MGLKQDIINAKVAAVAAAGADPTKIDTSSGSPIEVEAELVKEAVVGFLTNCEFRITQLNAPVILEDIKTPEQPVDVEQQTLLGDKKPILDAIKNIPGGEAVVAPLEGALKQATKILTGPGSGGATLPGLDLNKDFGGLESTGYVFIGEDPDSQGSFDVEDEGGQREFTTVKLFREDIEELL